jgi:hypothetical protein
MVFAYVGGYALALKVFFLFAPNILYLVVGGDGRVDRR